MDRGEAGQRGQVAAELLAPNEVQRLERGEAFHLPRKPIQFLKSRELRAGLPSFSLRRDLT